VYFFAFCFHRRDERKRTFSGYHGIITTRVIRPPLEAQRRIGYHTFSKHVKGTLKTEVSAKLYIPARLKGDAIVCIPSVAFARVGYSIPRTCRR